MKLIKCNFSSMIWIDVPYFLSKWDKLSWRHTKGTYVFLTSVVTLMLWRLGLVEGCFLIAILIYTCFPVKEITRGSHAKQMQITWKVLANGTQTNIFIYLSCVIKFVSCYKTILTRGNVFIDACCLKSEVNVFYCYGYKGIKVYQSIM